MSPLGREALARRAACAVGNGDRKCQGDHKSFDRHTFHEGSTGQEKMQQKRKCNRSDRTHPSLECFAFLIPARWRQWEASNLRRDLVPGNALRATAHLRGKLLNK